MTQATQPYSAEIVARLADPFLSVKLSEAELQQIADLLNALSAEMQSMRDMDVGTDEPAPVFKPSDT